MKASHRKGVATHPDPESCVASRKATIEALTGAHVGRALSCEIIASGVPTSYHVTEGHTAAGAIASRSRDPRSLKPQACIGTPRARTWRPHRHASPLARRAWGRRAHAQQHSWTVM